jgi:hypothetical protein
MGQKSLRAHMVRFAPESGLKSDIAGGSFRANSGHGTLGFRVQLMVCFED